MPRQSKRESERERQREAHQGNSLVSISFTTMANEYLHSTIQRSVLLRINRCTMHTSMFTHTVYRHIQVLHLHIYHTSTERAQVDLAAVLCLLVEELGRHPHWGADLRKPTGCTHTLAHCHRREREGGRQGEGEKESKRGREEETERKTDRKTDRQAERQKDRQRDRETDRQTDRQTEGQSESLYCVRTLRSIVIRWLWNCAATGTISLDSPKSVMRMTGARSRLAASTMRCE